MKRFGIIAAGLALASGAVLLGSGGGTDVVWEYRLEPKIGTPLDIPGRGEHQYQKLFDSVAGDGWEFVDGFGGAAGQPLTLVFRRPKKK